jgi:hypothetical protein
LQAKGSGKVAADAKSKATKTSAKSRRWRHGDIIGSSPAALMRYGEEVIQRLQLKAELQERPPAAKASR